MVYRKEYVRDESKIITTMIKETELFRYYKISDIKCYTYPIRVDILTSPGYDLGTLLWFFKCAVVQVIERTDKTTCYC